MYPDEFLTAIKADRERQIKAAERARLVDRSRLDVDDDIGSPGNGGRLPTVSPESGPRRLAPEHRQTR